jgi:hypothetical protein
MIIAYDLFGEDNLSYMWDTPSFKRCPRCNLIKESEKRVNPNFTIKKKWDISYTYDGYLIVSSLFKGFVLDNKLKGVEFEKLPNSPGYFHFKVDNIVEFDIVRRKTKIGQPCKECGQSLKIIGATPVCLTVNDLIKNGIFRTDILFGENDNKTPVIVIGTETYEKIKDEGLTGLDSHAILSKYEWEE